jgi:hypothetical protein
MKKYLWLLAPALSCGAPATYFFFAEPFRQPEGVYIDHTYLAEVWLGIGTVTTLLLGTVFLVDDVFNALERRSEQKRLERYQREHSN